MIALPWRIVEAIAAIPTLRLKRDLARKRSQISRCPRTLGFGGVLDPVNLVHGGAVKLLSLRSAFPCSESAFDILYLVSSAQPRFPEDLAKTCRKRGIRLVWNQNGVGYPAWAGPQAGRHNAVMRRLRASADHVIYQSEFCRVSAARFLGADGPPSCVLLNPVDLRAFSPGEPLPARPLRLLAVGTQNYPARVFHAVDALAALRKGGIEASLTVAGRLLWKNAGQEVARHAARVGVADVLQCRPEFSRAEAPALYRSHHILVHPKYKDPCPTVVAEALACGLPVVAPASGGLPEMTDPLCSRLIPVPDSWEVLHTPSGIDMAAAVAELAANLPAAAQAARHLAAERFDEAPWIAAHARIFSAIAP